ncbi:MAG TPA: FlgD immunoglobulin-like domain containing protein, partial [Tepiditoga sp.]|nr:FlgD immunoglobulin-like domain containing protein [Tepiditoga sp.]
TVNGIDTTVYNSASVDLDAGSRTITWDGNDNDGNQVAPGTYTFYVWGYDYMKERHERVTPPAFYFYNNDYILCFPVLLGCFKFFYTKQVFI